MVTEPTASILIRWIPLLPLAGAGIHALMLVSARRLVSRTAVTVLSSLAVLSSFMVSLYALSELIRLPLGTRALLDEMWSWMGLGVGNEILSVDLAFQFDGLSAVFALMITGVGLAVHVYAVGFMAADHRLDAGYQRFFCYLDLLVGALLLLVLADNLLLMFVGWQLVGLCVALLIAFWYSDRVSANAGNRAFVVNFVGDVALLVATAWIFWTLAGVGEGTLTFRGIQAGIQVILQESRGLPGGFELGLASLIGLCVLVAACAKSAQVPLHFWCPDTARAPAPAAALVMVSVCAGVYLCCRLSFLFEVAPETSAVIGWLGGITALTTAECCLSGVRFMTISASGISSS
jgi:NADH-quinone oxidoreductase subunit L